jgi:two-component system, OmpR family, sensor histidine kinase KdpD
MKRTVIGTVAALVSMALLTGVMLPLRDHLSIATTALVLVVPASSSTTSSSSRRT